MTIDLIQKIDDKIAVLTYEDESTILINIEDLTNTIKRDTDIFSGSEEYCIGVDFAGDPLYDYYHWNYDDFWNLPTVEKLKALEIYLKDEV